MDIYNLSGFKWWCKQRRKSNFLAIVFILFFLIIFGSAIFSNLKTNNISNANIDKSAIVMLIIMFLFFVAMLLSFLRTVLSNTKIDKYWCGTITNSYIKRYGSTNNRKRRLFIVANVNGKEIEARCMSETYHKAQQGDQIIIFCIKGDRRLYCVHPEM